MGEALLFCGLFLGLFALIFWPLLFRESRHWKTVFFGANIFYFLLLAYAVNLAAEAKHKNARTESVLLQALRDAGTAISHDPAEVSRRCREIRGQEAQDDDIALLFESSMAQCLDGKKAPGSGTVRKEEQP